ncbi:hypothetical protein SUS17_1080 [Sphingomonas sp. S17]|nr:hypothetical protein SUS17_1080 [Sphingomonas sp. S17]
MSERKREHRRSTMVGVKSEFILRHARILSAVTGITNANRPCWRPVMGLPF